MPIPMPGKFAMELLRELNPSNSSALQPGDLRQIGIQLDGRFMQIAGLLGNPLNPPKSSHPDACLGRRALRDPNSHQTLN